MISQKNIRRSLYAIGIITVVVFGFMVAQAADRQDIRYTITDNGGPVVAYYNVKTSGNKVFNWKVDVVHNGPGDMHPVTIGAWDEEAGSAPTTRHHFAVPASGKGDYAAGESGSFTFSYDTNYRTCGRVQIDGSFIDERFSYQDGFLFFAMIVDYGDDCETPTPPPVPKLPVVNISANPTSICRGDSSVLTWTSKNATQVSIDNGIGNVSLNGSKTVRPTHTTIYNITAVGAGLLVAHDYVTVSVKDCTPPTPPTINISANPTSICRGDSSVLTWTSKNATRVSINNNIGNVSLSGSMSVNPAQSTVYVATAYGSDGQQAIASVNVSVRDCTPPTPPTINISANPTSICRGDASVLTWTSQNATSVTIDNGIGAIDVNGSQTVRPSQTTTYTATARNNNGATATASATISVRDCNQQLPSVSIRVSPSSICPNESSTLTWESSNADYLSISPDIGQVGSSGSRTVYTSYTKTYVISARNNYGSASDQATLYVNSANCGGSNSLTISKTVRNITSGGGYDQESVSANNGDTVEFTIRVNANSYNYGYINNLRVSDYLPGGLRYVSGSTTVDGSYYSDGITSGGINLGNRYNNYSVTIKFRAYVESSGYSTLINTANASADNANTVSDTAQVSVGQSNQYGIDIQKYVRNTTRGETDERKSTSASSGNTLEFILRVRNTSSNTLYNVIVSDPLPGGLTYSSNSTALNGYLVGDGIVGNGINIGSLSTNQEAVIKFFVTVNYGISNATINNIAQAKADNVSNVYSSAAVVNVSSGIVLGALTIKTGAGSMVGYAFGGALLITLAYYIIEKRKPGLLPKIFVKEA